MRSLAYTDGETFTLDLRGLFSDLSFIQTVKPLHSISGACSVICLSNITEVGGCFHVLLVQQSCMREVSVYAQNHSCIS